MRLSVEYAFICNYAFIRALIITDREVMQNIRSYPGVLDHIEWPQASAVCPKRRPN